GAAALDYAFGELGLERVCSTILPENTRSIGVARRLGFTFSDERVLSHLPAMPHGIWWLERRDRARPS
ncbi:MAG TPA: GNAT family N-acetyltransferase, partial [Acidimicrobiales bacterium]|nr:GNAT family N-acetyltransferase [Acidimicrobiales bacterium]